MKNTHRARPMSWTWPSSSQSLNIIEKRLQGIQICGSNVAFFHTKQFDYAKMYPGTLLKLGLSTILSLDQLLLLLSSAFGVLVVVRCVSVCVVNIFFCILNTFHATNYTFLTNRSRQTYLVLHRKRLLHGPKRFCSNFTFAFSDIAVLFLQLSDAMCPYNTFGFGSAV